MTEAMRAVQEDFASSHRFGYQYVSRRATLGFLNRWSGVRVSLPGTNDLSSIPEERANSNLWRLVSPSLTPRNAGVHSLNKPPAWSMRFVGLSVMAAGQPLLRNVSQGCLRSEHHDLPHRLALM